MRFFSKSLVVAVSVLLAGTPSVPAAAIPLPVVRVQPVEIAPGAQLVDHRVYQRRHWRGHRHWRSDRHWGRHHNRYYRDRWNQGGRYDNWRGHRHGRYYRHRDNAWVPLAILGMGAAVIGNSVANERRVYAGGRSHVNWCANRYRSYRAYDNTFQPYNGPRRQCRSPYR